MCVHVHVWYVFVLVCENVCSCVCVGEEALLIKHKSLKMIMQKGLWYRCKIGNRVVCQINEV